MANHSIFVTGSRCNKTHWAESKLGERENWVKHTRCKQLHISTALAHICEEYVRVLVVTKQVNLIHIGGHF